MTDILTMFGEHFALVLVGCMELIVAVILLGISCGKKQRTVSKYIDEKGIDRVLLRELQNREDEVFIVLRRKDIFPSYVAGDMESLLGIGREEIQQNLFLFKEQFQEPELAEKLWKSYRKWDGKSEFEMEFELKNAQWIQMTILRDEKEDYDLVSFYRITSMHHQIEECEQLLNQAEEESQSKTTYLSRMSHEIRTPMNGIIGMLTLVEKQLTTDNPAMKYLTRADELSEHLLSLINDILDMSRIEAGKVELEEKVFSLQELRTRLYNMFARELKERKIRYEVNFEDVTVDYVIGDELRVSQVIVNFLSNAVKFTQQGEIIVTFRQMLLNQTHVDLMIRVHDTGIGMKTDFINRIFRPFEQEEIETSHKYGGTGLGMAITDQLVKLMGGEIVVKSVPGKGSDFSVFLRFPIAETMESKEKAETESKKKEEESYETAFCGTRILLAEDNDTNAVIAEEILKEMGAEVEVVENGKLAVTAFRSHPENYYDFILMDVQMPVMDGRTATRKIRSLNRADAKEILIFALSADAFVEDERLSMESGMNGHFAKPVDFNALQYEIGKFLRKKDMV